MFEESEKTTVTCPAGKYMKNMLKVTILKNAEVPFTATIKRTSELGVERFHQKGTWKGIMVADPFIDIQ